MRVSVIKISREIIALFLIAVFVFLFLFVDFTSLSSLSDKVPGNIVNMNTIFLSIFLEAIPFVLLGVIISACIQAFISESALQRILPKHMILAMIPAALIGCIMPMCECAIVPVVRRLIKKGMPLHIGTVFLVSVPILNPIVFASTFYAFRSVENMVYWRMGLAFISAMIIGLIVYFLYGNTNVLKKQAVPSEHTHLAQRNRFAEMLFHASDEFFETGKYLVLGAVVSSLFQTFFDRALLIEIASDARLSPLVMMGFGYILSLCSEADAFIAASLSHTFSPSSLLAFLVFGPMIDLKNTIILLAYFKKKFVISLILIITSVVYTVILIFDQVV
ncbi:permease [Bacillus sp. 165]|uniref:permease n=1 Tax=Bacillus sp. 165 TaxID=1529117 RepID=UPI001ADCDD51|nr:permease [Bacillus sp. 165]MBO9128159.1 permease [Bacillus sp. 165]